MPTHTTQLHHSKKTNTYTKQQTQDIKSHPTRNHQHVLYQILRKTHKPNSTTNKFLTKQDNTNTKPMATTLRRYGSNGTKHIKNNRRHMYCTTHPNTHIPNEQTRWLPPQKTPEIMEKRNINIPHYQKNHQTYHPKH
jgi:hypothetical protein